MPNYDFECRNGHTWETFVPLARWAPDMTDPCLTQGCEELGLRIFLPTHTSTALSPIIYFESPTGEIRLPGSSTDHPTPKGWIKKEATTYHEAQRLEHRLSKAQMAEISATRAAEHQRLTEAWGSNRQDILGYLSSGRVPEIDRETSERTGETVYTGRTVEMTAQGRDFMQYAMEKSNKRLVESGRGYDPGMFISALHNDERKK